MARRKVSELEKPTIQGGLVLGVDAKAATTRVMFVEHSTAQLIQIEHLERIPDVKGAIVKVSPQIRTSERAAFDGARVAADLRAKGAIAVILAPRIVPDDIPVNEQRLVQAAATSPDMAVRSWFDELKGVPQAERDRALELALDMLAKEV